MESHGLLFGPDSSTLATFATVIIFNWWGKSLQSFAQLSSEYRKAPYLRSISLQPF